MLTIFVIKRISLDALQKRSGPKEYRYYPRISLYRVSLYRVFTVGRSQVRGFKIIVDHCGGEALGTGAKPRSNTHILDFEYLNHPLEVD